jgi:hypothetical protein
MTVTPNSSHDTVRRLTVAAGPFEVTIRDIAGVMHRDFTHAAPTLVDILADGRSVIGRAQ